MLKISIVRCCAPWGLAPFVLVFIICHKGKQSADIQLSEASTRLKAMLLTQRCSSQIGRVYVVGLQLQWFYWLHWNFHKLICFRPPHLKIMAFQEWGAEQYLTKRTILFSVILWGRSYHHLRMDYISSQYQSTFFCTLVLTGRRHLILEQRH